MYTDRTLTCVDCGQSFTFTARDQEFYAQRSFTEPRRCPSCRAAKKAQREGAGGGAGSYGGGYSSGG
ncbi:MAG TPA: zinc-ribbon domain-containing protein, partial [Candidatus Dormibacteraeota bacterium]|nr:zinc-ribbon domain-containing protein [Candidatus Dormibacteraeota bacterium]